MLVPSVVADAFRHQIHDHHLHSLLPVQLVVLYQAANACSLNIECRYKRTALPCKGHGFDHACALVCRSQLRGITSLSAAGAAIEVLSDGCIYVVDPLVVGPFQSEMFGSLRIWHLSRTFLHGLFNRVCRVHDTSHTLSGYGSRPLQAPG